MVRTVMQLAVSSCRLGWLCFSKARFSALPTLAKSIHHARLSRWLLTGHAQLIAWCTHVKLIRLEMMPYRLSIVPLVLPAPQKQPQA